MLQLKTLEQNIEYSTVSGGGKKLFTHTNKLHQTASTNTYYLLCLG